MRGAMDEMDESTCMRIVPTVCSRNEFFGTFEEAARRLRDYEEETNTKFVVYQKKIRG